MGSGHRSGWRISGPAGSLLVLVKLADVKPVVRFDFKPLILSPTRPPFGVWHHLDALLKEDSFVRRCTSEGGLETPCSEGSQATKSSSRRPFAWVDENTAVVVGMHL